MNNYRAVFIVMLACIGLTMTNVGGCSGRSPEWSLEHISKPPYIEKEQGHGKVVAIFDDLPNSAIVRVIVERNDGFMLTILHPKCSPLEKGRQVKLIHVDYMATEMYSAVISYIKE